MKKTKKPYVHIHKKNRLKGAIIRTYTEEMEVKCSLNKSGANAI